MNMPQKKKNNKTKNKKEETQRRDRDENGNFIEGNKAAVGNGAPLKLTYEFIDFMEDVLDQGMRMIIFTDLEWVTLINERLRKIKDNESKNLPESISQSSWDKWKAKAKEDLKAGVTEGIYYRFLQTIKRLMLEQKEGLFNSMATDEKAWTRWAWIIERKFDDWNIKHKIKDETPPKRLTPEERAEKVALFKQWGLIGKKKNDK